MAAALQLIHTAQTPVLDRPIRMLPVPWRDPHSVSPGELKQYISFLEKACEEHPRSADLRTCLGMAYAMNFEVYKSMDALEAATALDELHYFAQLKFAELFFRLRALERAEEETVKALNLAGNGWELSMARKLLQEIRQRRHDGTQKPTWNKPLRTPALSLLALVAFLFTVMMVLK
jgi:tetratricopeptide (TPR) repeat protein